MPIIALAGGTSPTLGRSIVHAIQTTSNANTPIILTRASPSAPTTKWNAAVRQVDYANHISLVAALRGVHTLLCVLSVPGRDEQLALLAAAREAGVKRFAPSEFGMGGKADGRVDVLGAKGEVWQACLESGLEVGRFCCGVFMNYLAVGWGFEGDDDGKGRKERALAGLDDMCVIWDVGGGKAEEPTKEDGGSPRVTLTDIWDVGRFVAGACELPLGAWEEEMSMVGETIEISKVTGLIEKYSGRRMEVTKVKRQELQERVDAIEGMGSNREEFVAKMLAQFALLDIDEEVGGAIMEPTVNKLCPWVKAKSVEEYLQGCWAIMEPTVNKLCPLVKAKSVEEYLQCCWGGSSKAGKRNGEKLRCKD